MDTKYYPAVGRGIPGAQTTCKPAAVCENLYTSLKALNTDKIDVWYLHGPDGTTPFGEAYAEMDKFYIKRGTPKRFAISSYMAWIV